MPSLSVSNDDLSKIVDTSDEWISVRTGIRNRRVISGQNTLHTSICVEYLLTILLAFTACVKYWLM